MLDDSDLDAAVAEGLLTQGNADALRAFAASRGRPTLTETPDDEHFRFLRGFNDLFFAIGILFLGFGFSHFAGDQATGNLFGAAAFWALAELLIGRMRLTLPGIILACFFALFLYRAVPVDLWLFPQSPRSAAVLAFSSRIVESTGQSHVWLPPRNFVDAVFGGWLFRNGAPTAIATKALVARAAAIVFYGRFRLPFALLLVAGSLVVAVWSIATLYVPDPEFYSVAFLLCGVVIFGTAMIFDVTDRERKTRRADCAFWLHLLAAPLIVNSLIGFLALDASNVTTTVACTVVATVTALTLVAIIVDRRALLVSALSYVGIVVASAIRSAAATDNVTVFFMTLVFLGLLVLTLGVGWLPLRRWFVAILPFGLADRLPPVVPA
jgi:hypothetical protein